MLCKRLTITGGAEEVFPAGGHRRPVRPPLEGKGIGRLNESMASRESAFIDITPEVLLKAYSCGIFPMAESADDPALYWIEPERRGIIPLDRFHLPGRLARTVRSDRFRELVDRDFDAVLDGCAEPMPGRTRTWINERIRTLYRKLYQRGDCHTVEVYEDDQLAGGLYGVSL